MIAIRTVELKKLYKEYLQNDCIVSKPFTNQKYPLKMMICSFSKLPANYKLILTADDYSNNTVQLPMLMTDGRHHVGAYFSKQAITLFKRKHSGSSFLSLFGAFIKVIKWHFEFIDVHIPEINEDSEVYTSYQGKELRFIIDEFEKISLSKKLCEDESESKFTDNLHWDPDIKLEIARLRHIDFQLLATPILPFEDIVKIDMKKTFTGSEVVDIEKIIRDELKNTKQQKEIVICKANKLVSCFTKIYKENIKQEEPPLEFHVRKDIDRESRRKTRYFSRQSITNELVPSQEKKRVLLSFQFKIQSTRSSQSFNFEGKDEDIIA